jgi:hypothetical protein
MNKPVRAAGSGHTPHSPVVGVGIHSHVSESFNLAGGWVTAGGCSACDRHEYVKRP